MKRIAWTTDIHLNFLPSEDCDAFLRNLALLNLDGLVISGDVAESHDLAHYLIRIQQAADADVYFVLGNHDFYYGSIRGVRAAVDALCAEHPRLHYLSHSGPLELASDVALVGHDGWADGRLGDYERSLIFLHDYQLIAELSMYGKAERRRVLERLGDEAACAHSHRPAGRAPDAPASLAGDACPAAAPPVGTKARISDDQWAPHFTCRAVGDAILEIMPDYPDRQLTVLCGHTHGAGETRPLDNVLILTGGAEYGRPVVQRVFEL